MRLILDANEYVFAFGPKPKADCVTVLELVRHHELRTCRTIVQEVLHNLPPDAHEGFFVYLMEVIDRDPPIEEDWVVPFELGAAYEAKGFKPADAFIAAYAETVAAELIVSENRHFLLRAPMLPFDVLDAKTFVRRQR